VLPVVPYPFGIRYATHQLFFVLRTTRRILRLRLLLRGTVTTNLQVNPRLRSWIYLLHLSLNRRRLDSSRWNASSTTLTDLALCFFLVARLTIYLTFS